MFQRIYNFFDFLNIKFFKSGTKPARLIALNNSDTIQKKTQ